MLWLFLQQSGLDVLFFFWVLSFEFYEQEVVFEIQFGDCLGFCVLFGMEGLFIKFFIFWLLFILDGQYCYLGFDIGGIIFCLCVVVWFIKFWVFGMWIRLFIMFVVGWRLFWVFFVILYLEFRVFLYLGICIQLFNVCCFLFLEVIFFFYSFCSVFLLFCLGYVFFGCFLFYVWGMFLFVVYMIGQ